MEACLINVYCTSSLVIRPESLAFCSPHPSPGSPHSTPLSPQVTPLHPGVRKVNALVETV